VKRGIVLKEELQRKREFKEQKDLEKVRLAEEKKQAEIQRQRDKEISNRKHREEMARQKVERDEKAKLEARKDKLSQDVAEMQKYSRKKTKELCTDMFLVYRKRYVATTFNVEQSKFYNDQETHKVVEAYRDNQDVAELFTESEQTNKEIFDNILKFQNAFARTQG